MENETKKSKLTAKDILAKTGPGIIMAAAHLQPSGLKKTGLKSDIFIA